MTWLTWLIARRAAAAARWAHRTATRVLVAAAVGTGLLAVSGVVVAARHPGLLLAPRFLLTVAFGTAVAVVLVWFVRGVVRADREALTPSPRPLPMVQDPGVAEGVVVNRMKELPR